jgi:nucleoside phosphorylase/tetratricopeptide (TPR) repeat protein
MDRNLSDKPDILIVTVTPIECEAVKKVFSTENGRNYGEKSLEEFVYYDFGDIGGARAWMVRIAGMGNEGTTGSTLSIQKAIKETSPQAIIMVGIAFGIKQNEHQIGDVLISRKIFDYESQKVVAKDIISRGDRVTATARLIQKFESIAQDWSKTAHGVPVYCGLILSGDKLVDDPGFRAQLIAKEPDAIGGEMEGVGLFSAAIENHVDWILIKAISDWGDGNKGEDKQKRQAHAAENAARLTYYVLEKGNIARSTRTIPPMVENHAGHALAEKFGKSFLEENITAIEQQLSSSNYKSAVEIGRQVSHRIGFRFELDNPDIELLYGKFWTFFAIALIYSEGTEEAFPILNKVVERLENRGNLYKQLDSNSTLLQGYHLVLGRAYNYLGYGYWMDKACYGTALKEFHNALGHFAEGKWEQETATAYDNLGRVYAQLGHRMHAEFLIGHGLHLRTRARNEYRRALSLNSSAILHLSYGNALRAVLESEEALNLFTLHSKKHGSRGRGLALITKGRALRMLGSHWRYASDYHDFHTYLDNAIDILEEAERIFSDVDEDIRVLQAQKELGCAYRESFLMSREEYEEERARMAAKKAEMYYETIIASTESKKKYPLLYVDVCHDLALFYFLQQKTSMAGEFLNKAIGEIPPAYRAFTKEVDLHFSEDYWQILGKIYWLKGDLAFRAIQFPVGYANGESLCDDTDDKNRQKLEQAFRYYVQSAAYFGRFLAVPVVSTDYFLDSQSLESHSRFAQKLYECLSDLHEKDLLHLQSSVYQQVIKERQLDASWIEPFFNQSFDLLLRRMKM